jgi:pimeloyl-ACP methyl ester carboxylesterase
MKETSQPITRLSRRTLLLSGSAALLGACAGHRFPQPRDVAVRPGADQFSIAGGKGHEQHRITVHYYLPRAFTPRSPVLLVLPGADRNGFDYRDAWIPFASESGVLVAVLSYAESEYDFAAYQMGGVIRNLKFGQPLEGSSANVLHLRDEDLHFEVNPRRDQWLYNDFDRLFHILKKATGSKAAGYDMFGHSAGAQILQRHVLLFPGSHARRIVAANAGFYTLPDLAQPQPLGLAGLGVDRRSLRLSFSRQLLLLLGESNNDAERGGMQLHTPLIDSQGTDRLARGRYFHAFAEARARTLQADFLWDLRVVRDTGADFRGMARLAANIFYG